MNCMIYVLYLKKSLKHANELENLNKTDNFLRNLANRNYKQVENMGENYVVKKHFFR